MNSQTATATIDSTGSCAGDTVLVPVNVTDFIDIGAMTIFIGYDTLNAEFLSLENINPAIPGFLTVNADNGQVGIAYSNIAGFTLTNGKLFDLRYYLISNYTDLTFNPGTEIANTELEVIPLDTTNGGIYNAITIHEQPDSVQAYPDTDVTFIILASGDTIAYQWEENTGSDWVSLQNNDTYSGVNTDSLTIHDVPLSFDGYTYRCLLTSGNCSQYSDIAMLEVNTAYPAATIGQVQTCPENTILEPVFVGDFYDVVEFTFIISFSDQVVEFLSLQNIHPDLQNGDLTYSLITEPYGVNINWVDDEPVSINSGKLFDMNFNYFELNTPVEFESGSEVLNSSMNQIDITLTDGDINQHPIPVILTQPESQTVKLNDMGIFAIEAIGTESFQWQVSTDDGQNWSDLINGIPYYNVNTSELTIDPVTWDLNGYQYACRLTGEYCEVISAPATLTVDTLTLIRSWDITNGNELKLSPNPASSITSLSFESPVSCKAEIRIQGLLGQGLLKKDNYEVTRGNNSLVIDVEDIVPGLYLVELWLNIQSDAGLKRAKLIKVSD
jgi:hypothetical protein